ncbi:MAG: type II toxin-antitoxin system RelE/ParE family toxin [Gallionella sp.]|nr:type II toxin-antitoxin system RelE/ParE family toxin [Gallionella sp.]MDP1941443.1 type II toxin-antitoxin system RelE/ParE family toxin [Gallionella sp.]
MQRLFNFLAERDYQAAVQARQTIAASMQILQQFPFTCRKMDNDANNNFLRELLIPFDSSGYVALFEIEDEQTVTIIAVRHQREEDYH